MRQTLLPLALAMTLAPPAAQAAVQTRTVEYRQGDAVLQGFLAWDDAGPAKKPGVLVVHDWTGVGPYVKRRAGELARLGYVAFAADVYGKGVHPTDPKDAAREADRYKADRKLFRARVLAGLAELRRQPNVQPDAVAAVGYCFGGTGVLELARAGADVRGVVSVHGGLDAPDPDDGKNIKAKVLLLHGAEDPFVPEAQVRAVEEELRKGGVDWQLVKYSGAVHAFSVPEAGNDPSKGAAYDARADRRSWTAMRDFLDELFR